MSCADYRQSAWPDVHLITFADTTMRMWLGHRSAAGPLHLDLRAEPLRPQARGALRRRRAALRLGPGGLRRGPYMLASLRPTPFFFILYGESL